MTFDPETHRALAVLPPTVSLGGTPRARAGLTTGLPLYNSDESPAGDGDAVGDGGDRGDGGGRGDGGDAEGRSCCVVFPATFASIARWPPSDAAKSGVIVFAG